MGRAREGGREKEGGILKSANFFNSLLINSLLINSLPLIYNHIYIYNGEGGREKEGGRRREFRANVVCGRTVYLPPSVRPPFRSPCLPPSSPRSLLPFLPPCLPASFPPCSLSHLEEGGYSAGEIGGCVEVGQRREHLRTARGLMYES